MLTYLKKALWKTSTPPSPSMPVSPGLDQSLAQAPASVLPEPPAFQLTASAMPPAAAQEPGPVVALPASAGSFMTQASRKQASKRKTPGGEAENGSATDLAESVAKRACGADQHQPTQLAAHTADGDQQLLPVLAVHAPRPSKADQKGHVKPSASSDSKGAAHEDSGGDDTVFSPGFKLHNNQAHPHNPHHQLPHPSPHAHHHPLIHSPLPPSRGGRRSHWHDSEEEEVAPAGPSEDNAEGLHGVQHSGSQQQEQQQGGQHQSAQQPQQCSAAAEPERRRGESPLPPVTAAALADHGTTAAASDMVIDVTARVTAPFSGPSGLAGACSPTYSQDCLSEDADAGDENRALPHPGGSGACTHIAYVPGQLPAVSHNPAHGSCTTKVTAVATTSAAATATGRHPAAPPTPHHPQSAPQYSTQCGQSLLVSAGHAVAVAEAAGEAAAAAVRAAVASTATQPGASQPGPSSSAFCSVAATTAGPGSAPLSEVQLPRSVHVSMQAVPSLQQQVGQGGHCEAEDGASSDEGMEEQDVGPGQAAAAVAAAAGQQVEDDDEEEFDPLVFIKSLPPLVACVPRFRAPLLPRQTRTAKLKTLVLDLDETLVHSSLDTAAKSDFSFPVSFNDTEHMVFVRRRPHLSAFMERVAELFEVVVFTASQKVYAEQLLNIIDPTRTLVKHRIYRDSCVIVEGNYLKDLSALGRDLAHTLIIDNSPQAFGFQVDNGVPIESWYEDERDVELLKMLPFLESLVSVDDVRPHIRGRFRMQELIDLA